MWAKLGSFSVFFILHNRKLGVIAFSQKTLSIDFASCCARWNFWTWKKRAKLKWNRAPPLLEEMNCVWIGEQTQQNIWNSSIQCKKKDVVCLSLCPGACWDVAKDGVVIWSWATADDGSEYTSVRAEPKVLLSTFILVTLCWLVFLEMLSHVSCLA